MPASVSRRTGYSQRPFSPSFIDAGATATTSPLSASTTDTSPTTSLTNFPSAARWRGSFPACAVVHTERRAA